MELDVLPGQTVDLHSAGDLRRPQLLQLLLDRAAVVDPVVGLVHVGSE